MENTERPTLTLDLALAWLAGIIGGGHEVAAILGSDFVLDTIAQAVAALVKLYEVQTEGLLPERDEDSMTSFTHYLAGPINEEHRVWWEAVGQDLRLPCGHTGREHAENLGDIREAAEALRQILGTDDLFDSNEKANEDYPTGMYL